MNKLEQEMISAIVGNANKFITNTCVYHKEDKCVVSLHGNTIAIFDKTNETLTLDDCGWCTKTTHSRLNAILEWFYPSIKAKRIKGRTTFVKGKDIISVNTLQVSIIPHVSAVV